MDVQPDSVEPSSAIEEVLDKNTLASSVEHDLDNLLQSLQSANHDDFQKIILTNQVFTKIKDHLQAMVQDKGPDLSMFTRITGFWGKTSWWYKIILGLILIIPTLVLGIIAHIGILITLGIAIVIVYSTAAALLSDHYQHQAAADQGMAKTLVSLATISEFVINTFSKINGDLDAECIKLGAQVKQLEGHLKCIQNGINQLVEGIDIRGTTNQGLIQADRDVAQTLDALRLKIKAQSLAYADIQKKITLTLDELHGEKLKLSAKNQQLCNEREASSTAINALKQSIQQLASTFSTDQPRDQHTILAKIDELSSNEFKNKLLVLHAKIADLKRANEDYESENRELVAELSMLAQQVKERFQEKTQKQDNTCVSQFNQGIFSRERAFGCGPRTADQTIMNPLPVCG